MKKSAGKEKLHLKVQGKDKEPNFMVQIADPKGIRKEMLESLRDIIIFMQGYEKFRKIQQEKVNTFGTLKLQIKEINSMVDHLKVYLTRGKLRAVGIKSEIKEKLTEEQPKEEYIAPVRSYQPETPVAPVNNELEELESQLKDIENQLRGIQ